MNRSVRSASTTSSACRILNCRGLAAGPGCDMPSTKQRLARAGSAIATALTVACAVTATSILVWKEFVRPSPRESVARFTSQPDWRSYAATGRRLGSPTADIVLVEFADFQCPACKVLEERLRDVRERFGDRVAVVYRHFPLPIHQHAHSAAVASECAGQQGRFDAFHQALFTRPDSIGVQSWEDIAARAGVPDTRQFERCRADSAAVRVVQADVADAHKLGLRGTPTVLVNGVRFTGTIPQATLDSVIEAAIGGARRPR